MSASMAFEVIEAVVLRFNKAITRRQASRVAAEGVKVHVNPTLLNAFTTLIYNSLTNYLVSNMYIVLLVSWVFFMVCFLLQSDNAMVDSPHKYEERCFISGHKSSFMTHLWSRR